MLRFLVSVQCSLCGIFLVTNLTLIFPAFMYWMNMYSEITLCCCKIFNLHCWQGYFTPSWTDCWCCVRLSFKENSLSHWSHLCLIFLWTELMWCCKLDFFYKVISTFSASMLLSKMFGFVVIVIISLFGENFIAKVTKYGSHFLPYLFSTLMVTVKRINFFL